jgi:hypothetical protein
MEELLFEEVTEDGIVADLCLGMPHSRTSADMQELLTPQPVNV